MPGIPHSRHTRLMPKISERQGDNGGFSGPGSTSGDTETFAKDEAGHTLPEDNS